jgi:hypothetical protein
MRHLETLRGSGFIPAQTGKTKVEFEFQIHQEQIPVRSSPNPNATIPGMKSVRGWVRPFVGSLGQMLTLEMDDGQTAKFFFTDTQGSVTVNWIGIEQLTASKP